MSKLPYMPFFGNDFFGSSRVKLMSAEEKVAYLTLLWFQWVDDGLPVASDDLRKLTTDLSEAVLDCFPVARDNRRRNPALEHHRRRSKTMSAAQSKRAKSRWDIRQDAMPDECPDDAQKMPSVSVSVSVPEVSSGTNVPGAADGESTPKSDLATVMGAIRKFGYRDGKPPKKGDDARDATVARHLLESHPVESVVRAVEGARLLVESGALGVMLGKNEPYTLRLLNAMWGGKSVFTLALDAYYAGSRDPPTKRERSAPTSLEDLAWKTVKNMGAA